ncbi:MAG TPA: DUF5665 domain-containing protein [Vitreimonas sp.]|nr:DUF5665 domain-containing protein [Vitreimonas sp.]
MSKNSSKQNLEPAHRVYRSRRDLFIDNLVGGVAWGFGSVMGATVIVAIILLILAQVQTLPFVGNVVRIVIEEVRKYQ